MKQVNIYVVWYKPIAQARQEIALTCRLKRSDNALLQPLPLFRQHEDKLAFQSVA